LNQIGLVNPDTIKVVSWDVDGTLYSIGRMKRQLIGLLVRETVRRRGRAAWTELAQLQRYRSRIEAARKSGGALGETVQQTERTALLHLEQHWYGQALRRVGLRPGATELLEFFAAHKIPQVVFSDYQAGYKLEVLGLKNRFASTYAGECLGHVKPSPEGFERIAADFGIPPINLLHIGDRVETDGAGARAAGCQSLILGRDFSNFATLLREFQSSRY
jgi:putative hydrolase of the HAD superfamily